MFAVFSSNVQPKVVKRAEKTAWYCHHCDQDIAAWHKRCPSCRKPRND